ncbi:hypothetical protein JTB14_022608 [Gonioctena quinquepunctata]|nr:hypothetical protein JTB14_022608 [Gonioctena quinquepunctata]
MSETGSSESSTCFICGESLREGDVVLVKEKGVQTLRASSAALKNRDNEHLLRRVTDIYQFIQSEKDADRLIVTTALAKASDYDLVIIAGEDIDLLVIFTGLVRPSKNVYFQKCGRGKTADVFYSAVSTSSKNHHLIPFVHVFSGCDTTSAFFGHGKAKLLTALKRDPQLKEQASAFLNPTSTPVEIAAAGEQASARALRISGW